VSEADAFERALAAHPDDLAGWCAYADYLVERGDPRGEFMQTQIALEDESRPKKEREALRCREQELLVAHEREWLGELAPSVLDATEDYWRVGARFTRGWLSELAFRWLTVAQARALARSPGARLLGRLVVENAAIEAPLSNPQRPADSYYEPGPDVPDGLDPYASPALHALLHVPHLAGLRVFGLGGPATLSDGTDATGYYGSARVNGALTAALVARMPRIEELYLRAFDVPAKEVFALPMPRLRVLLYDHCSDYPLEVLAANPSPVGLTYLSCHPHAQRPGDPDAYIRLDQLRAVCRSPHLKSLTHLRLRLTDFGDEGIEELVASGLLERLRVLDLGLGCVTDRGAALLAARPELKNLELLDLSCNAIGPEGIALLDATGVLVGTDEQHGEHPSRLGENGRLEYLSYGDME
jgi:uncharacterized protein (TIGR02996 family)